MSSRMLYGPALYMPGVHFIVSRSSSALSHRKPAPAGMSPDGCRAGGNDKTDDLYLPILRRKGKKLNFYIMQFSLFLIYFIARELFNFFVLAEKGKSYMIFLFDIWLAVHHSITYLLLPTWYTNLLFIYTYYIKLGLYMFRAHSRPSSEGQRRKLYVYSLWYRHSLQATVLCNR